MVIQKSAWIEVVDHKILSTRSNGKRAFYIPGGKPEPNETNQEALIREIKEELSVDLIPESIQSLGVFTAQADGHTEGIQVQMNCFTAQYSGKLIANSEIAEFMWLSYEEKSKTSHVDHLIFDWLRKQGEL